MTVRDRRTLVKRAGVLILTLAAIYAFQAALAARDTCSLAQFDHRMIAGSYARCIAWNAVYHEDDDR